MVTRVEDTGRAPLRSQRLADGLWRVGLWVLVAIGLIGLIAPTLIVVVAAFDTRGVIGFPPEGFSTERFQRLAGDRDIFSAALTSLGVGIAAVAIDLVIGVPAAIAIVRREFRGKSLLVGFLQIPIMLPGIVVGIALLLFVSALGMDLSFPMLVAGHVVITLPFVLRIAMARMERADIALEEAARNLGASRWAVLTRVQLPFLTPALAAGSSFAFLTSFDNLTVSLFLTPVRERTLPVELFFLLRFDLDPVVAAVATLQIGLTFVILLVGLRMIGEKAVIRT